LKQLRSDWNIALFENANPAWRDLSGELLR
jgi:hypothetical protein